MHSTALYSVLIITGIAMITDIYNGKIPNRLIAVGIAAAFCYQLYFHQFEGILLFLAGMLGTVSVLFVLYLFRMIGAGDVKLFGVIGGIMGIRESIRFVCIAFVVGAVYSLIHMLVYGNLWVRLLYFVKYCQSMVINKKWEPYYKGNDKYCTIYFTIPIFVTSLIFWGIYLHTYGIF